MADQKEDAKKAEGEVLKNEQDDSPRGDIKDADDKKSDVDDSKSDTKSDKKDDAKSETGDKKNKDKDGGSDKDDKDDKDDKKSAKSDDEELGMDAKNSDKESDKGSSRKGSKSKDSSVEREHTKSEQKKTSRTDGADRDYYKISYLHQRYTKKTRLFNKKLRELVSTFADERGNVSMRNVDNLFREFADTIKMSGAPDAFDNFTDHAKKYKAAQETSRDYLKNAMNDLLEGAGSDDGMIETGDTINYDDFLKIVESWIESNFSTLEIGDVESDLDDTDPVKFMMMNNIEQYEALRDDKIRKGEDTTNLDGLISMLNEQLEGLEHEEETLKDEKRRPSSDDPNKKKQEREKKREATIEAKREKGLKEIFIFYARQHYMVGRTATFEDLATNVNKMFLGEFNKFVNDFGLNTENMTKVELSEVFKQSSQNCKALSLPDFYNCMDNLAAELYEKHVENKQNDDSDGTDSDDDDDNEGGEPKPKKNINYFRDLIYEKISPERPSIYRNKMSGFSLPFGSDPNSRIKPTNYEYKPPSYLKKDDLKKMIEERKKARQDQRDEARLKHSQPRQNGLQNSSVDTRHRSRGSSTQVRSSNSSSEKRKRIGKPLGNQNQNRVRLNKGKPDVVTLGDLQNMNNEERTVDLHLDDLINDSDSDDEDAEVLGQYGIKTRGRGNQLIEDKNDSLEEAIIKIESKKNKQDFSDSPVRIKRKLHAIHNRSQDPSMKRKASVGNDGLNKGYISDGKRRAQSKDSKGLHRKRNDAVIRSIEADSMDLKNQSYKTSPKSNNYRNVSQSINVGYPNTHNSRNMGHNQPSDPFLYNLQNAGSVGGAGAGGAGGGYHQAFNPTGGNHYKNSPSMGSGTMGYAQQHQGHHGGNRGYNPNAMSQDYSSSGHVPHHRGAAVPKNGGHHNDSSIIAGGIRQRAQEIDEENKLKEQMLLKMHNNQIQKSKRFKTNRK